nr:reverse transcriptase domain-containing protein [Tanacetum cinerariifolium]
ALIGNKEKLSEMARTTMNEHCLAVILTKLPRKLGDPGKFLIPCEFSGMDKCLALADLGASINLMPLSVWEGLSLPELTPTCMTLELADRSVSKPLGIAKDVSFKVGDFHFPTDFVVVDFETDPRVPLILGRCFLKTSRALIDVHKGELTLRIKNEAITYNLDQTVRYSANYNQMTANKIDVVELACEEYSQEVLGFSNVTDNGTLTPQNDSIVSITSPTLTPFDDSDFLLFEEADAFLDPRVPLILGRCFLKTSRALIDVHKGELTLRIGNEAITYNLDQTVRYSANYNQMTANKIDVVEEYSQEVLGFSNVTDCGISTPQNEPTVSVTSPTLTPFGDSDFFLFEEADAFLDLEDDPDSPKINPFYYDPKGDILLLEAILNSEPSPPLQNQYQNLPSFKEELKAYEAQTVKSSVDEPPEVELKDLPHHLEYAFLKGDDKLPVIIAKELRSEEKSALIKVLKSYKRAIAWKLSDIQGINSEFYTHKILMEEDYKPAVQHQRRVNSKIHDVIKKEVEKLLDAGLIYPISDSPWVSPENAINFVQTFLRKFNRYSFLETPKVVLLSWDRVFEIKDAFGNKQYKQEDMQELFRKFFNEVQNIHEELAEYINTPGWNRPAFYKDDDDDDVYYTIAITPVLSFEELDNSLSMGDEHLDTISAMESDEVIKSSVEDLVPIPSESEVMTTLYNKNIEYVEASPHDSELLLNVHLLLANIEALKDNPTPSSEFLTKSSSTSPKSFLKETTAFHNSLPEFENFCFDLEEISSGSTTTHSDISLPDYEAFSFYDDHIEEISSGSFTTHSDISLSEYDSFIFDLLNDQFPLTDRSDFTREEFTDELAHIISPPEYDCFYFGNLPDPVEDDHSPLLAYVVWIFLAYLTYPVIPPYLYSFGNEDTIFDPGIAINRFYSFKLGLSHRCGTFKKFNTHRSHLNESPMEMSFSTCFPMDQ